MAVRRCFGCLRGTLRGARHNPICGVPASRSMSVAVQTIEPPRYAKVPMASEEPAAILADMPELLLSGARASKAPSSASGSNAFAGLTLNQDVGHAVPAGDSPAVSNESAPETKFGQLANGVRIAAVDRQGLCASLGLFVHAGSRYEEPELSFLPHALELMAFRSSAHLSHIRTMKTLEQLGAAASCRVGREDILYQFDVLREYVPIALPLMLANVLCPAILPDEVAAAHEHVAEVRQNLEENVESLVCEHLHLTAYRGNTLGNQLYADAKDLPHFTDENVRAYLKRECTPDRLIIVGVNVDFDELCKWTARSFSEHAGALPAAAPAGVREMARAAYTGGDFRMEMPNPLCHLMLGWEVAGGWNGPMLASVTVLQMFLGGGGSFSTGGPGKGMHTRLYTEVLNRHHWVESCQASSVMYADSGLFTIYGTIVPQHADDFVSVIKNIFKGIMRVTPEELQRAKNALKSSIHMNLEMRAVMMEDIGRQLILSGKVGTAQEFGKMVDAVTIEDLRQTLWTCLRTNPTVVAYGAIEKVPTYESIRERLAAPAAPA